MFRSQSIGEPLADRNAGNGERTGRATQARDLDKGSRFPLTSGNAQVVEIAAVLAVLGEKMGDPLTQEVQAIEFKRTRLRV